VVGGGRDRKTLESGEKKVMLRAYWAKKGTMSLTKRSEEVKGSWSTTSTTFSSPSTSTSISISSSFFENGKEVDEEEEEEEELLIFVMRQK